MANHIIVTLKKNITPFFFLYLSFILYILFLYLDIPVNILLLIFNVIHIALFIYLLNIFSTILKTKPKTYLFFWGTIFLFLLLPGAYLEFPADSWEHLRRIFRWQAGGKISDYPFDIKYKFAYFLNYSFIWWVPILKRRLALDILSAIWQFLLVAQVYRIAKKFNLSDCVSFLAVVSFLVFFGTNIFSVRYYALSSTPLAYICYLEGVLVANKILSLKNIVKLILLFTIIIFNHIQEALFLTLSILALFSLNLYLKRDSKGKDVIKHLSFALLLLSFLAGVIFKRYNILSNYIDYSSLNLLGGYPIYSKFFLDTLGAHGILALLFATVYLKKNPKLSLLTIMPSLVLLLPPFALPINAFLEAKYHSQYLAYRILYMFPSGIILAFAIYQLSFLLIKKKNMTFILALFFITILSYNRAFPWRGRLWFQLYNPPKERTMKDLDKTAQWFYTNTDINKIRQCWITTDDITRSVLYAHIGGIEKVTGGESARRSRLKEGVVNQTTDVLRYMVNIELPFCGILVGILKKIPPAPKTIVGEESGHWTQCMGDLHCSINKKFANSAKRLPRFGWSKVFVPPYYYFYQPPTTQHQTFK